MENYKNYPRSRENSATQDPPKKGTSVPEEQPETGNDSDPFRSFAKAWDNMSPDRQYKFTTRFIPIAGTLSLSLAGVFMPLMTKEYTEVREVEVQPATIVLAKIAPCLDTTLQR